jgi:acyl carrier protein
VLEVLHADYPEASADSRFDALGMDSLDYTAFIVDVEEACGVDIPKQLVFDDVAGLSRWLAEQEAA